MATIPQRLGQVQWGDLLMGPGTGYAISDISGVDDLPEVRNTDVAKSDAHGDYTGPDYTGPRTVQIALNLVADTPDQLRQMILALRRATQPGVRPRAIPPGVRLCAAAPSAPPGVRPGRAPGPGRGRAHPRRHGPAGVTRVGAERRRPCPETGRILAKQ